MIYPIFTLLARLPEIVNVGAETICQQSFKATGQTVAVEFALIEIHEYLVGYIWLNLEFCPLRGKSDFSLISVPPCVAIIFYS